METVKILSVEKKKKYYLVMTNGDDYKFDEDIIIKYQIFNGKEFTEKEFAKIIEDSKKVDAYNLSLRYLAYGARSRNEMAKYLKSKGASNIKVVLDRLEEAGYINDVNLANYFVGYYKDMKKGPIYIAKRLQEKMVDEKVIESALSSFSEDEQLCIALNVAKKEQSNLISFPVRKQKEKIYSSLLAKGYSSDVISKVLNCIEFVDESDERLVKDYESLVEKASRKNLSNQDQQKWIIEHLLRKGYEYQKIKDVLI